MTAAEFLVAFPEFNGAAEAMITAAITAQTPMISDSWDADRADLVLGLRVADSLARSPFGRNARMVSENKITGVVSTTYRKQLNELIMVHGCARGRLA